MIEFDVRRARNGRLVISHDAVREPSAHLPSLEDTLRLTQGRIQLDVELKEPGCEGEAIELLLRYFPLDGFCMTSFMAPTLHAIRSINPSIRTGLIFAMWNKSARAACLSPDVDLLVPHYRLLNRAGQMEKPLFVWTVDDPALTRALFAGALVAGIVTNNPRQALAVRRDSSPD